MTAADELTERQRARRDAVLTAARELARDGGYDAVQMRDVARRAGVAMGTVYHYFSSKDHLLAGALAQWTADLERDIVKRPPSGANPAERVEGALRRMTRAMSAEPNVSAAVVTGLTSPGEQVAECQRELHHHFTGALLSLFEPSDDDREALRVIRSIEHVWYSGLIGWVNGWMPLEQAVAELLDAAAILLARFDT